MVQIWNTCGQEPQAGESVLGSSAISPSNPDNSEQQISSVSPGYITEVDSLRRSTESVLNILGLED